MFVFRLKRTAKLGIKSLWMHKLRSTLTTLGIIFGVSSVIAMLFVFDDPLGQDVKIRSDYYRVIGVVSPEDLGPAAKNLENGEPKPKGQGGANVGSIYIPLTTTKSSFRCSC